jgi:hypothetical protein
MGVLKSVDFGAHWSQMAAYVYPHPAQLSEPQVTYDPVTNNLFIVTTRSDDGSNTNNTLIAFAYSVTHDTLGSPIVLATSEKIKSDYSVCYDGVNQEVVVVASVTGPLTPLAAKGQYAVVEFVLSPTMVIKRSNVLMSSPLYSGNTFGAVQVVPVLTGGVDLYWLQFQRKYSFTKRSTTFYNATRTTAVWPDFTSLSPIYTYLSEFNGTKFTVVPGINGERFLAHLWYVKQVVLNPSGTDYTTKMGSQILLGYVPQGGTWNWTQWAPTGITPIEPTMSLQTYTTAPLLTLACLDSDTNHLSLYTWDPIEGSFTQTQKQMDPLQFQWIRGTQGLVDNLSSWAILGLNKTSPTATTPVYVSQYALPPVATFTATTSVLTRQTVYTLDASGSSDPNLDPMAYTWSFSPASPYVVLTPSTSGVTATLEVLNTFGPQAGTITVSLSVQDLNPVSDAPSSLAPTPASKVFTIPFIPKPITNWYSNPVSADRNSTVVLDPVTVDPLGLPLTYQWTQTYGTTVDVLSNTNSPVLTLSTSGVGVLGETLTFCLTVSDNINPPQRNYVNIQIPSIKTAPGLLDFNYLNRSFWAIPNTNTGIANRNQGGAYTTFDPSVITTDFSLLRSATSLLGYRRYLYVSSKSCLLLGDLLSTESMTMFKVFAPNQTPINSAWVTEKDGILLVSNGSLYTYSITQGSVVTDDPLFSYDLSGFIPGAFFKDIWSCVAVANHRPIAFPSNKGLLLLLINDSTGVLEDQLVISVENNLLYGGNNIQWVRGSNVEGLNTGFLLIGSADSAGNYYETYLDLASKSINGKWDSSNLINKYASTGEILLDSGQSYYGSPLAPQFTNVQDNGPGSIILYWSQARPDLVAQYQIFLSVNGGLSTLLQTISSGAIQSFTYNDFDPSNLYSFTIQSSNPDGLSPMSAALTYDTSYNGWVDPGWVEVGWVDLGLVGKWTTP